MPEPYSGNLAFALESQGKFGRFSFYGQDPYLVFYHTGGKSTIITSTLTQTSNGNPLDTLRKILQDEHIQISNSPVPFTGGAVGFLGYGLGSLTEGIKMPDEDLPFPDLYLAFYNRIIAIDKLAKKTYQIEIHNNRKPCYASIEFTNGDNHKKFSKEGFLKAVKRAKQYIKEGDIYEVNLSKRFTRKCSIDPIDLYKRLKKQNPSPFACFLPLGNTALISTSPEEFLYKENEFVRTRPIKGTKRRGKNQQEDLIKSELLSSIKDDAELAMIVDLERNDFGKVCQVGSVRVTDPKSLETYPTLFHTAATIEGKLQKNMDLVDLIKATFPGGSVTGAPKKRAMEIISELEPTHRGPYTGAIGYIGLDGTSHLSMAIRIVLYDGGNYHYQTGGAIVYDSIPECEYDEILVKARALENALDLFKHTTVNRNTST